MFRQICLPLAIDFIRLLILSMLFLDASLICCSTKDDETMNNGYGFFK